MDESVDSRGDKKEDDQGGDDDADDLKPLEPDLVVPTNCLEHAPETMAEVSPNRGEPNQVDDEHPPLAERGAKQVVRVILEITHTEHLRKLHLRPEMGKVEEQQTEDNNSKDEHVLRCPRVSGGHTLLLIALQASASLDVLVGEVATIENVHDKTQSKDRDHDVDERRGHEVAT